MVDVILAIFVFALLVQVVCTQRAEEKQRKDDDSSTLSGVGEEQGDSTDD